MGDRGLLLDDGRGERRAGARGDAARARDAIRPEIARWLERNRGRPQLAAASCASALPPDGAIGPEQVEDAWIDELAVVGNPQDCRAAVERLGTAGADAVVLVPGLEAPERKLALLAPAVLG